jgi:replicative DNA helicase
VIIIDYLQILSLAELRGSDKQNTDKSVFELKRLSRDFKIPIIGISSLNRDNYNGNKYGSV